MNTSEKIKMLRIQKKLSQEELGNLVGLQKAAINKYETGRVVNIKKSMLQKLASALDVSPADLLDDQDESSLSIHAVHSSLTPDESSLLDDFNKLNNEGKAEAQKRVNELTEIKKYIEPDNAAVVETA